MIELTVLGTSGSSPAKGRGMPAVSLKYEGDLFLFDCGEGTQMQMLRYGVNPYKLKAIFLSHAHGDHVIGIAGLVRTLALNNRKEELLIFVPRGYEKIIRNLIVFDKAIIGYRITMIGVQKGVVYKARSFTISAFKLDHTIPTYGYVFKENDRRRFIKEKFQRLGLEGEMFSEIERKGSIKINGRRINIESLTRLQTGRKVVYASDTRPTRSTISAARGADILVHESSYTGAHKELAVSRKHSTAADAAALAKSAKVKCLILVHLSTRYKTAAPLMKEAKKIFNNTIVPNDGYKISI